MSVWDDLIHHLEQDLIECRKDLELLESGQMEHRERRSGGPWVNTTQREIDWHKKTIGMYDHTQAPRDEKRPDVKAEAVSIS
jgi:hypothetical protein